ncbi:hypothetical protein D8X55_00725 [Malacoplasma penetrans]|uniref:hypothetical protein n=1 Tax=Malacoplasma penetrans TaxID=28227 RepID=UPI0002D656D3|nr:hypothetical protein [Malacoplasma penetrans]RXY97210.1 hypothetical protein D8X55_00725 [Malacoplasma penetrans]
MLSAKITKSIIEQILKSTPGVNDKISASDIEIKIQSFIYITINVSIDETQVNVLETAKMIQKQVFYDLTDKTDLKNFKIDIFLK